MQHTCQYHAQGTLAGRQDTALNPHHNYFLLADNGTSGIFSSSEICLRRRLEQYLAQQPIGLRRLGMFYNIFFHHHINNDRLFIYKAYIRLCYTVLLHLLLYLHSLEITKFWERVERFVPWNSRLMNVVLFFAVYKNLDAYPSATCITTNELRG